MQYRQKTIQMNLYAVKLPVLMRKIIKCKVNNLQNGNSVLLL